MEKYCSTVQSPQRAVAPTEEEEEEEEEILIKSQRVGLISFLLRKHQALI
jgi:hypothetical protein